jgi:hypothetical protein
MRLRLAIAIAVSALALVWAAQALADPPAPESPAEGANFVANGNEITFRASVPLPTLQPSQLEFLVSRDSAQDANGRLANWFTAVHGAATGDGAYQGSTNSDDAWPNKPGDYAWQAVNPECTIATDCNGPVRHFTIGALPASAVTNPNQVETFLNKKPRHRTRHRKVKFSFSSNVKGAKFQCLFATGWEKCHSPHIFRHLKAGRYQFEVRAVVNGIEDPDPEAWVFRVLRRHHH